MMSRDRKSYRAGFTLVEMLIVMTMIAILMTVSVMSAQKARTLARRARAEAELREMVNAWLQYKAFYGKWPDVAAGKVDERVTGKLLHPIIDPGNKGGDNPLGVVFLNVSLKEDDYFLDPWKKPYRISFDKEALTIKRTTALDTSVFIKFAQE